MARYAVVPGSGHSAGAGRVQNSHGPDARGPGGARAPTFEPHPVHPVRALPVRPARGPIRGLGRQDDTEPRRAPGPDDAKRALHSVDATPRTDPPRGADRARGVLAVDASSPEGRVLDGSERPGRRTAADALRSGLGALGRLSGASRP